MMRHSILFFLVLGCGLTPLGAAAPGQDGKDFPRLFNQWKKAQERERGATGGRVSRRPYSAPSPGRRPGGFGMRTDPIMGRPRYHAGVDLPETTGTPVYATADGRISTAGRARGYGLLVTIRHPTGYETRYAHMSRIAVTSGQFVQRGRLIGYVGSTGRSTGPHLHYEVRLRGQVVDPAAYM